jgi:hypothetical protein
MNQLAWLAHLTFRSILILTRKWRNWQTHQLEGLEMAPTFDSSKALKKKD